MPMENPRSRVKMERAESTPRKDFLDAVARHASERGISEPQAKRDLFFNLIKTFDADLGDNRRFVSSDSDLFEMYEGALQGISPRGDIAGLSTKEAGREHAAFREVHLPPATQEELASARLYLGERFKGAQVIGPLAADYLDLTRELEAIVARLSSDERFSSAPSIPALFGGAGEIRADVARMLEIKRRLALHEGHLLDQLRAKEAERKLVEEKRSYFNDAFAQPLIDFFKVFKKNAPNAQNVVNVGAITLALLPLFAKFTFHTGKLLYRAAQSVPKAHPLGFK
jgi:hypothetical protein